MESRRVLLSLSVLIMVVGTERGCAQLAENFYNSTCPGAESVVKTTLIEAFTNTQNFSVVPGILRLFYHDCFVEGCDASIMIDSPNGEAEKDAEINHSLTDTSFEVIFKAKQRLEAMCPGVVSCADILAIAAREAIVYTGGPNFNVELGRRDGFVSDKSRAEENMPQSYHNFTTLSDFFARKNLSQFEMITLVGAHTIGISHCKQFSYRLYPPHPDPSLNETYAKTLMRVCPEDDPEFSDETIFMDPDTPRRFDNNYYNNLMRGKGLHSADEAMHSHPVTKPVVESYAQDQDKFFQAFVEAFTKMGRIGVKTGSDGEIRNDCRAFNS